MSEPETIEVAAEEVQPEAVETEQKDQKETRESLKQKGWSAAELDAAEKRGMIEKPAKEKDANEKATEGAAEKAKKDKEAADKAKPPEKIDSSLPDFTITDPAKEKVFLETFGAGTPQRAMYFRMKNERAARQRAEERAQRVEAELESLRKVNKKEEAQPELDENGNVIDPEDKPLTMKQLKAMQKAEQEDLDAKQREFNERSAKVSDALKTQEEYAKSLMPDFEDTVKLAVDLITNIDAIPEKWKRDKVVDTFNRMKAAAANADKYGVDDYNSPMLAYELGQMHEKYGQKAEPNGDPKKAGPKENGGLTPEQMKRIQENTERRAASASLPSASGGKRSVSVDDVTLKDVNRMSPDERYAFKKKHPAQYDKLMRG